MKLNLRPWQVARALDHGIPSVRGWDCIATDGGSILRWPNDTPPTEQEIASWLEAAKPAPRPRDPFAEIDALKSALMAKRVLEKSDVESP